MEDLANWLAVPVGLVAGGLLVLGWRAVVHALTGNASWPGPPPPPPGPAPVPSEASQEATRAALDGRRAEADARVEEATTAREEAATGDGWAWLEKRSKRDREGSP